MIAAIVSRTCRPVGATLLLLVLAGCAAVAPAAHEESVTSVAFSPDHSLLAFADAVEIQVFDVATRTRVSTLRALPPDFDAADARLFRFGVGDSMVFLDNARIASTGMGGLISVWDARSGGRLSVVDSLAGSEFASTLEYSETANRLVVGTSAGTILLSRLDGDVVAPMSTVATLEGYVQDLVFGPDGRYFASALLAPVAEPSQEPAGDSDAAVAADPIEEGEAPAFYEGVYGPADGSKVTIWDAQQLERVGDLAGAGGVTRLALVPEDRALLTVGDELRVWEFLTLEQAAEVEDPSMAMQYVGIGTVATFSAIGMVASLVAGFYVPPEVVGVPFAPIGRPFVRTAAISPDGRYIVSTTRGPSHNVMAVIERSGNKVVEKWTADYFVYDLEFSPDGKYLLVAGSSGARLHDALTWKSVWFSGDEGQ